MSNDSRFQIAKQRIDALFNKPQGLLGDSRHPHLLILFILSLRKFGALPPTSQLALGSITALEESARRLLEERGLPYILVFKELKPVIDEISEVNLTSLIAYFNDEIFDLEERDAQTLFDSVFQNYLLVKSKTVSNYVPSELALLISNLVLLGKDAFVYEPFSGLGFTRSYLADHVQYYGQTDDALTWCAGAMQLYYSRPKDTSFFIVANSIKEWLGIYEIDKEAPEEPFDLLLSIPPFRQDLPERLNAIHDGRPIRYVEEFVIDRGIHSISENGKMIVFVTNAFLTSVGSEQRLREYVVEKGLLKMVIQLPVGLLQNTNIPIVMLVFSKEDTDSGLVHFINASTFLKKANARFNLLDDQKLLIETLEEVDTEFSSIVTQKEIADEDYILKVDRYFIPKISGLSLSNILSPATQSCKLDYDLYGKFISIRNLKNDIENYKLSTETLKDSVIPQNAFKLEQSALLIAGRWMDICPTYFEYNGTALFVSNDIYAFIIDTTQINISYLVTELAQPHVIKQFEFLTLGDSISEKDFLRIRIDTYPLKEQKERAKGYIDDFIDKRNKEQQKQLDITQKINTLIEQQIGFFDYVDHELGNKLPAVRNEFSFLKKQFIYSNSFDLNLSTKVRQPLGDEDLNTIDTIGNILMRIEEGLDNSTNLLKNLGKIITPNKNPLSFEEVSLLDFFDNYCRKNISSRDRIGLRFSGDNNAKVQIDKTLFSLVPSNFISNAIKHGFQEYTGERKIEFNVTSVKNKVELIVKNNGKPFEEGFTIEDFITPRKFVGTTGNTGLGGYFIANILARHNADISLLPHKQDEEFKVKFLIIFKKDI